MRYGVGIPLVWFLLPLVTFAQVKKLDFPDGDSPYHPKRNAPRLTTPEWVGEEGVEAVVILAIDDMRGHTLWENYLRPILNRLKKIDGRAPVSIMACSIDPKLDHLQTWLKEGLSLEVHTIDHPCPLLNRGNFEQAKSTYDRCVDLMNEIPNSRPVAFRTPCCDSQNTVSPRFFAEIFNHTTAKGNYLQIDSSVFQIFTGNDPELPRDLVFDADGRERFRKYQPANRSFVNFIEDYPYPYIINRYCWEFPCMTPSDWQGQNLHGAASPITLRDWKAALDCTVLKKGVFCFVFHPYNWVRAEQMVDFIDYADTKYGKRVKFLTFKEALERLQKNVTGGKSLRELDVPLLWTRRKQQLQAAGLTLPPGARFPDEQGDHGLRFVDLDEDGHDDVIFSNDREFGIYLYSPNDKGWTRKVAAGKAGDAGALPPIARGGKNNGFFVHERALCWQNETTDNIPSLVLRVSFNDLLREVDPGPKDPQAALQSIKVAPGYRVELVAAEPLVQDPVALAFGPDGKLWVVEMSDYPLGVDGRGKPGGRIKYLESTRHDGRFDKATLFADGLPFPTGVLPWRDGILVTAAPNILFIENVNGKAGRREVLFTGFGEWNQQHRVNTLAWGIDNWIYVANGDSGGTIRSVKTGQTLNINGRDLRIRPDTGEMEALTGQTQFGRSRDDWGHWFGGNNANPMWHFVLEDRDLRRNPHVRFPDARHAVSVTPGVTPVYPISRTLPRFNDPHTANHFTSACSPMVYRDRLFDLTGGSASRNEQYTFVCEPVHNLIHREVMTPHGMTFQSHRPPGEERSEFLASSDNWFRPVFLQTGPDGGLWIADMYRAVIEHPEWIPPNWQAKLDLRAGHDRGRIYRVVPIHEPTRTIPRLDRMSTAELVAALDHPNGWQRDMAHMLLLWRADPSCVNLLESLARKANHPVARLHAVSVLAGMGKLPMELLSELCRSPVAELREAAVRFARNHVEESRDLAQVIVALAHDSAPRVRLEVALTLGQIATAEAAEALVHLGTTDDKYLRAAVASSLRASNIEQLLQVASKRRPLPKALFGDLLSTAVGLRRTELIHRMVSALAEPAQKTGFQSDEWEWAAQLCEALDNSAQKVTAETLSALQTLIAAARQQLTDAIEKGTEVPTAAIHLLGRDAKTVARDLELLARLAGPQSNPEVQRIAAETLARIRSSEAIKLLLSIARSVGPVQRSRIFELMLQRDETARLVVLAVKENTISPNEIDVTTRQRLLSHPRASVRNLAREVLGEPTTSARQDVIDRYRESLAIEGNPARGRELFIKNCAACHRLDGLGNEVGPDLAAVVGRPKEYLLTAILDPNRAVESRYVNYTAETKDGRNFAGVLVAETSTSVTLAGVDGKPQTILRSNLESLISTGRSAMPEGLEQDLTPKDMADLFSFLRSRRPTLAPKVFAGNRPELILPEADGSLLLSASKAAIFGPSLVFESHHRNLGYWSHVDDYASWTIRIPQAGRYQLILEYASADNASGDDYAIETEGGTITGKVTSTGHWDNYRTKEVGTLNLPPGEQHVTVRAAGPIRHGALMDLKNIRLKPIK
jgi:putative membrane-bound dehydrogenase-like protein